MAVLDVVKDVVFWAVVAFYVLGCLAQVRDCHDLRSQIWRGPPLWKCALMVAFWPIVILARPSEYDREQPKRPQRYPDEGWW